MKHEIKTDRPTNRQTDMRGVIGKFHFQLSVSRKKGQTILCSISKFPAKLPECVELLRPYSHSREVLPVPSGFHGRDQNLKKKKQLLFNILQEKRACQKLAKRPQSFLHLDIGVPGFTRKLNGVPYIDTTK